MSPSSISDPGDRPGDVPPTEGGGSVRRFAIRTYGCQMNVHDSQKVGNLLLHAGFEEAADEASADLLLINTCSIRDKAEQQLYSDLGRLREWKAASPGRVLGVGGCVAQQVSDGLLKRFSHLDLVFGTHNLRWVPAMVDAAQRGQRESRTEEERSLERFDWPERHPAYQGSPARRAFLTVMEGCDMFCSFCIVPRTRGREISRPAASILEEARSLAERGVREVTLLGQTVNAYGRHDLRRGQAEGAGTMAFGALLGALDEIPGLARIRYTSPHPLFFDEALIEAHGALSHLCPHVHLPAQSGSDAVLERMRRRYTRARYLEIVAALRAARSDIAISTDLIVGFPGETDADFEDTLTLMREARFVDSFSFKYSERPDTTAIELPDPVPPALAQERLERVQALQRELTVDAYRSRVGTRTEILLEGPSRRSRRKDAVQWTGRDPYQRVVNLDPPEGFALEAGALLAVDVVDATPHSLLAVPAGHESGRNVKESPGFADEQGRSPLARSGDSAPEGLVRRLRIV